VLIAVGIGHAFAGRLVLRDTGLVVQGAEVVGLWGPSGAGKSTLARILAGTLRPDAGTVTWNGNPLPPVPGPVQHVPQSAELAVDSRWTVGRVLENGAPPDAQVLDALGIRPAWATRRPAELSGGELARVSLARFLLPTTRLLICDEITAQLDALAAQTLWQSLLPLARSRGIALVVISHDPLMRAAVCDRQVELKGIGLHGTGSSLVLEDGSPGGAAL